MIWNELTQNQKDILKQEYNLIKHRIKKLNSNKANESKQHIFTDKEQQEYNNEIKNLQSKYTMVCTDYKCDFCGKIISLDLTKMKQLFKNNNKPIFCSKQCSGKYYAKKSHEGKTEDDKYIRNKKISNTLKQREDLLTEKQKLARRDNLNAYWNNMSKEERSIRNTEHCITAMENNKNNNIWQSRDETAVYKELVHRGYRVQKQHYSKGLLFDLAVLYKGSLTLIELNGEYWHHYKPFMNTEEDIKEYNKLIEDSERNRRIADKWRYKDVSKYNYCLENEINYIVVYFNTQIKDNVDNVCNKITERLNKGVQVLLSKDLDN